MIAKLRRVWAFIKRKRKFWRWTGVLVVAPLTLLGSFAYGVLCERAALPPHELVERTFVWCKELPVLRRIYQALREKKEAPGRFHELRPRPGTRDLDEHQRRTMDRLLTIGYVSGSEKATGLENVTRYAPAMAYQGLNLTTSGHGPEALLVDMTGRVLHRWRYTFEDAFPDHPPYLAALGQNYTYWRRAHLYENGDLLAIFDGYGLIKVDKGSNLIWANPAYFHHDLLVDQDGLIYSLTREAKVLPRIHEYESVLEDFVVIVDAEGNIIRKVSLLDAFFRSSYASFLWNMPDRGDLFHTNTIELLDGSQADRSPIFGKGNVLISLKTINVIAIVDLSEEKVVWALAGQWLGQHQPTLLDNGNILLLDNAVAPNMSKVIEIDPFTQETVWAYRGTPENGFFTATCGSNQRLPNGNTLITESDAGRAFEVTPDNQIVWEYYNPGRAGERNELIGTLFEVVRLPPDFPTDWLAAG